MESDIEVIAMKPFWNISELERMIHEGLSDCWHKGEWFNFLDDGMRDFVVAGLCGFYEKDRDMNSVDFIYWYNGSGMVEFQIEREFSASIPQTFSARPRRKKAGA